MERFSTSDICKLFHIRPERLRDWIGRGFICPSIPARGGGRPAVFFIADLYAIEVFLRLLKVGVSRDVASEITVICFNDEKVEKVTWLLLIFKNDKKPALIAFDKFAQLEKSIKVNQITTSILINFSNIKKKVKNRIKP